MTNSRELMSLKRALPFFFVVSEVASLYTVLNFFLQPKGQYLTLVCVLAQYSNMQEFLPFAFYLVFASADAFAHSVSAYMKC
jgi:hypothetical protein